MKKVKRKNREGLKNFILSVLIFGIGITIGKLINWGYFTISKEISIADALSMFITIGVAIYIAKVLERDLQDNRTEKDLLLKHTEEINTKINDCFQTVASESIPFFKITNGIQRINLSIKYVFKAIEKLNINNLENGLKESYVVDIKRLRFLLTDTPKTKTKSEVGIKPDIVIKENIVFLSDNRLQEVEQQLEEIKNKVFLLQIEINRY